MNKEELIKIYSAYLPYKLKIKSNLQTEYVIYGVTNKMYDNYGNVGLLTNIGWLDTDPAWGNKLILYPMDFLKKEIRHEGKSINVFEEIRSLTNAKYFNEIERYLMNIEDGMAGHLPYWVIKILLKYHFNVFQIPENEFINKATLK